MNTVPARKVLNTGTTHAHETNSLLQRNLGGFEPDDGLGG